MPEARSGGVHQALPERQALPEHVTTPLLALITARSLDEDYAHVAERRRATGTAGPDPRRVRWATLAAVGAFGLLIAVAAVQTSRDADVHELGRAALITQIRSRGALVADIQGRSAELTSANQVLAARTAALARQEDDLAATVERLEVRTGFTAVHGEGIRITLDNRPDVDVNSEIRDADLAMLVDGLWEAGAEAIAVDDQRLTALTGIRNTRRAINVNGVPVQAPYVVTAIGDRGTLQARLQETGQGQQFMALATTLGFLYEVDNVDDVRLPAATLRPLRHAVEAGTAPGGEETEP